MIAAYVPLNYIKRGIYAVELYFNVAYVPSIFILNCGETDENGTYHRRNARNRQGYRL